MKNPGRLKAVNLERDFPSVPQALPRLMGELGSARQGGVAVLKLIHGYGSSGSGGDLRIAIQATLQQMQQRGEIHACIFGEDWRKSDARAWALLKRYPELKRDCDFGRNNRGITIVVL